MATHEEKTAAAATRATIDAAARKLGHELDWKRGAHSLRKGWPYHYIGHCACGAAVMADAAGTVNVGEHDVTIWPCSALIPAMR